MSVPEIRKLLLKVVWGLVPEAEKVLAWSEWRRAHQNQDPGAEDLRNAVAIPTYRE